MLGFRPTKGVRNYAEQIEHAAGSDAFIVQLAITGSSKGIPSMGDSAVYLHNKAALRKYAAAAMDYTIARLKTVTDAQLVEEITSQRKQMPRARALIRAWLAAPAAGNANVTVSDSLNRLRVSPSVFNDQRDVDRLLEALS